MRRETLLLVRGELRTVLLVLVAAGFIACVSCVSTPRPRVDLWDVCADYCAARGERIIGLIQGEHRQLVACGCRDIPTAPEPL